MRSEASAGETDIAAHTWRLRAAGQTKARNRPPVFAHGLRWSPASPPATGEASAGTPAPISGKSGRNCGETRAKAGFFRARLTRFSSDQSLFPLGRHPLIGASL